MTDDQIVKCFVQPHTGMTHARKSCGQTANSHIQNVAREFTAEEFAARPRKCRRCYPA